MVKRASCRDINSLSTMAVKIWKSRTIDELCSTFKAVIDSSTSVVFLYLINGTVAGFAQCQLRSDYVEGTASNPVGYLEGVYVLPEFRENGYAKKLIEACQQWAKEQGCCEFASDCELCNTDSLKFHKSVGFNEVNRIICFTKKL